MGLFLDFTLGAAILFPAFIYARDNTAGDIKMSEEIKDKEQVKSETQKIAENGAAKPAEKKSAAKPETKKTKERPTNCAVCNKAFKHKRWYYKNGKYFCTKRCWEKLNAELKAKIAEAKEAEDKDAPKSPENPIA